MATFHLRIVTPEKVVLDTDVRSVRLPGTEGSFGVLPNHAPLVAELRPGAIRVVHSNGDVEFVAASAGYARVADNRMIVLVEDAERAENLDEDALKAAVERARAAMADAGAEGYAEARATLDRLLASLDAVTKQQLEAREKRREASQG